MSKRIKFTPAKLASLKHPIGKYAEKRYDTVCEGLDVFVMPQPSLTKLLYATLVTEYLKSGATIGNRIKTKGTKLKYKIVFQLLRLFFSLGILYK